MQDLKISGELNPQIANTTSVAQAISRAIDEHQELSLDGGLFLDDAPGAEGTTTRIVEVSAELQNAANGLTSIFQVHTSDGQVWDIRITPGRN
jgi:hypothetical protein